MNRLFEEANVPPAQWAQPPKIDYGGRRETLTDALARGTNIKNSIKRPLNVEMVFLQELRPRVFSVNVPRQIADSLGGGADFDFESAAILLPQFNALKSVPTFRYGSERTGARYEVHHPKELCAPPERQTSEQLEARYRELTARHFREGLTEEEQQELERVETRLDELDAGSRELSQVRTQVSQGYARLRSELHKINDILDGLLKS